jgi:hypothetical protein
MGPPASSTSVFSGTVSLLFFQATVPTGWTLNSNVNDKVLRVVNGGSTSGTNSGAYVQVTTNKDFSNIFKINYSTDSHTLLISQIPSHDHPRSTSRVTGSTNIDHSHPYSINSSGSHGHPITANTNNSRSYRADLVIAGRSLAYPGSDAIDGMVRGNEFSDGTASSVTRGNKSISDSTGSHNHSGNTSTNADSINHTHPFTIDAQGGGLGHAHDIDLDINYANVIIGSRTFN